VAAALNQYKAASSALDRYASSHISAFCPASRSQIGIEPTLFRYISRVMITRRPALVLCAMLLMVAPLTTSAVVFYWTGIGNGWKNQVAPTGTGGEDLVFNQSLRQNVVLPGGATPNYNSLSFLSSDDFDFVPATSLTLTLTNGMILSGSGWSSRLKFNSNVTFNLATSQTWDAGVGTFLIGGTVTGTAPLTLQTTSDVNSNTGFFTFNGTGNTYTGGTTINMVGSGANGMGGVAFWNNTPFGTGNVSITNGTFFSSHNNLAPIANNFAVTTSSTNPWALRSWDAPLTLSGTITLVSNAYISPKIALTGLPASNNEGVYVLPGPITRLPTIITGQVTDSTAGFSLNVGGPGILVLNPTVQNAYSGGTVVNNGTLVFGSSLAIPTGANNVLVNNTGYAGFGDVTATNFASQFLTHVNKTSGGSIGVDTLPSNLTVTLADNIDLSATGANFTNAGIRLGTSTSAILTGTIKPQGNNYQFGNGGGTLYVQSSLVDITSLSQVQLTNSFQVPLKLILQGTNTYTGGTFANNGILVFDSAGALPASGALQAGGANNYVGNSYIGYTDSVVTTPTIFLPRFNQANTWGVIGFDTHAGNPSVSIGNIDLTGFNNGVFLGTATSAILNGTLTPSTLTNTFNSANTLRFTAGNGGMLTVNSTLSGGGLRVVIGTQATPALSDGTVILNGTNSYTGGTTLNTDGGITLALGNNSALGMGALSLSPSSGVIYAVGLQTTAPGLVIPNSIVFQTPDYINNGAPQLALTGSNAFELSGSITSGPVVPNKSIPGDISLNNATPLSVTLSGNNSGYFGDIDVVNGTLTLANNLAGVNLAAGQGTINFDSANANVVFSGGATSEEIWGISGKVGSLSLPSGTNLTIHADNSGNQNSNFEFGGVISGSGASVTVTSATSNSDLLYLYGHNTYSGGTIITGRGALALGASDSAGTGQITVSATQGGLALNTGVTLTNPLNFTSGGLAGLGTFAPSSVTGTGQTAGTLTFGTGQLVFPGIPGKNHDYTGTLTIGMNTAFATGGKFQMDIQDPASGEGYGHLNITGDLNLTAISAGGFTLGLNSLDASGNQGGFASTIVWGNSYSLPFVTATTITGFNAANFTVDPTNFQGGAIPVSAFNVSQMGTSLYLNFTAVPEPSTWALMMTGLGLLGLRALRRRRSLM
jgi:fibronectin-binding autotransporter adhesin